MKLKLVKWGNSTALRLPAALLAQVGVCSGDSFDVDVAPEGLLLKVIRAPKAPTPDATIEAMRFAVDPQTVEGMEFLRCWLHGQFDVIRREWPEAPKTVFVGADPSLSF